MSEQRQMLASSVDRLFGELMATGMPDLVPDQFQANWQRVEELGLFELFVPENEGGFGGCWEDACIVFHLLGQHALPLPIGETLIAKQMLADADSIAPQGVLTVAICENANLEHDTHGDLLFGGELTDVPWAAESRYLVVACSGTAGDHLLVVSTAGHSGLVRHFSEANEPRDTVHFEQQPVVSKVAAPGCVDQLRSLGALLRASQMSGGIEAALELTVEYVNQRQQFGRTLSKFQVIQHQLAQFAEEAAAAKCASMAAARSTDLKADVLAVASAKLRANRAAGLAASIAHQAHGAIGFTREYRLHYWTQRLWAWRSEFGNDRYWSTRLGEHVLAAGSERFWANVTATGKPG